MPGIIDSLSRRERDSLPEAVKLEELFSYHAPTPEDIAKYEALRTATKGLVREILTVCQPSADRSAAIRLIREGLMTANASIALKGLSL